MSSRSDAKERARPQAAIWRRVYLRGLGLQAAWNPQRMQNVGLLSALVPWLRSEEGDVAQIRRFCRRHYEYFNTNPYFANYIVGGIIRIEQESAAGEGVTHPTMQTYRDSLAQSFAALGDQLFWLGLRPGVMLLAALAALSGSPGGALAVVAVFALGQLELRRRALLCGYARGFEIVDVLGHPGWHRAIEAGKNAGKLLTGAVGGYFFGRILGSPAAGVAHAPLLALAVGAALPLLARERLPGEAYLLSAAAIAISLAYVL